MKRIVCFLLFVFTGNILIAGENVQSSRDKYISDHKDDAIRDMLKTGVPASITLAQACLESQDGKSSLAREANNHFGIKCSDWNGPSYIQDDEKKDECFRKYKTTLDSYDDHSSFLRTRPRYAFLFQLPITDYKSWAKGLKEAGYATDPRYATRLIKIIEENQLQLLDQVKDNTLTASVNTGGEEPVYSGNAKKVYVPTVEVVDAFASRKILDINGVECITAKSGDDFISLAKEFKLGYWQLPKYNEMDGSTALKEGQIIYLKPKRNEGLQLKYIVKPGDSMLSIAQENGIKVKYIYKYNNLQEGSNVEPGQELYLKKNREVKN